MRRACFQNVCAYQLQNLLQAHPSLHVPAHLNRWEWLRGVLERVAALNGSISQYRKLVDSGRVLLDVGT